LRKGGHCCNEFSSKFRTQRKFVRQSPNSQMGDVLINYY
jgi:hypothetical protein